MNRLGNEIRPRIFFLGEGSGLVLSAFEERLARAIYVAVAAV